MQYSLMSGAAVLLALAPTAMSVGTAHVVNNCGFDVYYANVIQGVGAAMQILPSGGYSEVYSLANVGVSVKLATAATQANPTQFEFTWANGKINYDISNINGNPFMEYGMALSPSMVGDSANPTCQVVTCAAGENPCTAAYNLPDDTKTMVCNQASDLTMTLCPSGSSTVASTSTSARAVSSTSAAAAAAATSSEASVVATTTTWQNHGSHSHNGRRHARNFPTK